MFTILDCRRDLAVKIGESSGASRSRRVAKLFAAGAVAAGLVGFGIAAAMPASADIALTVEETGSTVEEAKNKAFDRCTQFNLPRGGTVNWEDVDPDGTFRVEVRCVQESGQPATLIAGHGRGASSEEAFAAAQAECVRQGFDGFTAISGAEIASQQFVADVACHNGDAVFLYQ